MMSKRDEIKRLIDLQLERELREMNDPALEAMIRRNEEFVGTEFNIEKAAVLDEMQAEATALRRSMPTLQIEFCDRESRERNGYVRLRLPCPVFIAADAVVKRFARLFSLADGVAFAAEGGLIITFKVYDLWK